MLSLKINILNLRYLFVSNTNINYNRPFPAIIGKDYHLSQSFEKVAQPFWNNYSNEIQNLYDTRKHS